MNSRKVTKATDFEVVSACNRRFIAYFELKLLFKI
ncbi:hypothetical protein Cycma_1594 [Cyclobacterium marinum DSM 745]|uniref:Uncharacterized protein n=1 Tax=Cyclobacterium marinum (strain ATCC 25205 / DSM 745 / LMG 13164 / NCIMB 1802) TaxID=880070 RepID=G0J4X0_CYCMS|nr:hypothetical protein Cycma_1594 [Cyclobacterium marinum DSM 745]